ncbi:hypothetical protein H0H92_000788 [Tricholoma furcatifolium]|nr:hypothetical protein H0H92_000788 [Tricholoma furcatifolium]
MDPYRSNAPSTSFHASSFDNDDHDDQPQNSMKAPKRKRLAKACDACHKSKRRCDGTAPCSNCYYAVKPCTYTDASGRPVPAPRPFKPERLDNPSQASTSSNPLLLPNDREDDKQQNGSQNNAPRKRFRNERGNAVPTEDISTTSLPIPIMESSFGGPIDRPVPMELDHGLTRELTNLFFTHCHPARIIIHKPTFTANLAHNRVPIYLLHAICALAAPLSKQPRLRTSPSRFAGQPFAQEAQSLMFDGAGRLVCERNLATAQALCLLQFHDLKTKDKTWDSRYHDLAMQLIESLNVYQPDYPTLTPVPSPEFIQASIEREAVRRMFWIIHFLDNLAWIYFKKPMESLQEPGRRLRLPVDETTFELGVHSTLPEYLYLPAVRMQYSSEFGHLIRVITIYAKVESALDELTALTQKNSGADPKTNSDAAAALLEAEHMMEARHQMQKGPKSEPAWALTRLNLIMTMLGDRVKNSVLSIGRSNMGEPPSKLDGNLMTYSTQKTQPLIKYCQRDDAEIRTWCAIYEEEWGTRMRELVLERTKSIVLTPTQHNYVPNHLQQQPPQQPQPPASSQHRRLTDVRNPPGPGSRPSHQLDSSFNHRSGSVSPTSLAVGRPLEDLRMHDPNSNGNGNYNRNLQSHALVNSDRDLGARGVGGPVGGNVGAGQGGNGGMKRERELERNNLHGHGHGQTAHTIRRPTHDGEVVLAALDNGGGGRDENLDIVGAQGQPRVVGIVSSTDGPQSLPSLKSVGLLAVQHQVSMPVGLQWLANE